MAGTSLNDLLYTFLQQITGVTDGATEDLALLALLSALDPSITIPADNVTFDPSGTVQEELEAKLPIEASIYTLQTSSFSVSADMAGKDVPVTITDGIITLPAWDGTGFGNGWQAKIVNLDTTALTYSGTVVASGTKQPAYSSRVIEIINGGWFIGGLTT